VKGIDSKTYHEARWTVWKTKHILKPGERNV